MIDPPKFAGHKIKGWVGHLNPHELIRDLSNHAFSHYNTRMRSTGETTPIFLPSRGWRAPRKLERLQCESGWVKTQKDKMKRKRYNEEQIIGFLKQHENGMPTQEVIRQVGTDQTCA